ncbi:family 1 glycosylhydrolase [Gordonia alkaliphila]|uniref:family 1 glycosylhydrolase n=1 Tax=Gordonia alkaliphila TaxID=1053547 RepID=UPI001FF12311|nr:family 1 glycosylhydrolase [Gordonia alkaliphila]MCK0439313.1 family 1 glycosylhydrolase [Gordonia alkaliphila]
MRTLFRTTLIALTICLVAVLATVTPGRAHAVGPLPDDFLWGVASSGFQTEGSSPDSNWRRYARAAAKPGASFPDGVGSSVDFRHRYREDVRLAAGMGVTVYRVGIEWARLEPRPGYDEAREWAYYDDLVAAIVEAGMRPMLTLDHWVYPGWIADRGGWADARTPAAWLRHQRRVVDRYAHHRPLWITVNEATAYLMKEVQHGGLPPHLAPVMLDRLVGVHRAIYDHIHRRDPGALVSSNAAYIPTVQPALDQTFLDRVRDKLDFIGFDYYYSVSPTQLGAAQILADRSWEAPVSADGLYYAFRDYARRFPGKPLYVIETGMPTQNGAPRPDGYRRADHLRDLVYWTQRARADGIDVMGLNYWSLTDNYEWGSYTPRFGLYRVDVLTDPTLHRVPTPAVAAYRRIIADGGVGPHYRPSRPATVCSLVAAPSSCTQPVR